MSAASRNNAVETTGTYTANGNRLGVVLLANPISQSVLRLDLVLRQWLVEWGQLENVDSIMLIQRNDIGLIVDVFEPWAQINNGHSGYWSTMCGNGIMVVARFYEDYIVALERDDVLHFQTRSGIRNVKKLDQNAYSVCMGRFTHQKKDLSSYVLLDSHFNQLLDVPMQSGLPIKFSKRWSIGLSGDRIGNSIDGEPHVVLFGANDSLSPTQLRQIALEEGPKITKTLRYFPAEINANFAVVQGEYSTQNCLRVLACTHERGLGDNAERSVTGACGTGATAIGATLYQLYSLADNNMVHIAMPGGKLSVYRTDDQFYLVGTVDA